MKKPLLRYEKFITREMMQAEPDTLFVFGDNLEKTGYGGQAAEMRGEPNAVGVPTKHKPSMALPAFFTDYDFALVAPILGTVFSGLVAHVCEGKRVVWPADGIGTGMAQLRDRAPKIWELIEWNRAFLEKLANG